MAKSSKQKTGKSKSAKPAANAATAKDILEGEAVEVKSEVLDDKTGSKVDVTDIPDDEDGLNMDDGSSAKASAKNSGDVKIPDSDKFEIDEPVQIDPVVTDAVVSESATNRSGGFLPLLLGGVAAGAIGYGVATYFGSGEDLSVQLAAQSDQIAELEARLAELPTVDLGPVESQIAGAALQTGQQITELGGTLEAGLAALDERLVEVEKRPNEDGTLSEVALAAYQSELEQLRSELEAQQEGVISAAAQAEADLAEARAQAETLEQQALAAAEAASARAALNRIGTAVETGAPFEDALSGFSGDIPAALSAAASSGVATSAQLASDFPAAARAALATARFEGETDDANGIGGFFRSQFDVRSTAPREGSDPDAVLSRAEAAMKEGRVADALAEIEALPEVARAEMTDWTAQATERADVLSALATLSETYN